MLTVSVCLSCVAIGVVLYWKSIFNYVRNQILLWRLPMFPMPYYPLFGHALSMPTNSHDFFKAYVEASHELATTNKEKICISWFGWISDVLIIHPDSAEVILGSSKHMVKSNEYKLAKPWIKDGLVMSKGKKWQQRRKLITPSFHYDILKDFLCIMNEHTTVFVDIIDKLVANGVDVNIADRLKYLTLDIICESSMGCKMETQINEDNEYLDALRRLTHVIFSRTSNPLLMNDFIFSLTPTAREQRAVLKILHKQSRDVIDKKLSELQNNHTVPQKRKAFLDLMVDYKNEDGSRLSVDDIQEEVDTFMFGGQDTTGITLTWTIYVLGRNHDAQRKLQKELDTVFAGDKTCDVTLDHINEMNYLDLVIKEVLRLYPPISFLGRQTTEECVIDGKTIPKGQDLNVFTYFIHRHPDIWEEPNKFIPERFETENRLKANRSPFAYIPFSAGPRNCIGQRYATQEMKIILAKLYRQFFTTSYDAEDEIRINAGLLLDVGQKLNIKIEKRTD